MDLFWGQGYEATSLHDLITATGLSKSSFYQAFGSKHALFIRCLSHYEQGLVSAMKRMLDEASTGFGFIEAVLSSIADETRGPLSRRGCLIMNTASEFAQSDPAIAKCISGGNKRLRSIFKAAVERAQREHDIPKKSNPDSLAEYLLTCTSGLKSMIKAGSSKRSIQDVNTVILESLKSRI